MGIVTHRFFTHRLLRGDEDRHLIDLARRAVVDGSGAGGAGSSRCTISHVRICGDATFASPATFLDALPGTAATGIVTAARADAR